MRDGQHSDTLTIARVNRMPWPGRSTRSTPGIVCRSARVMSSVRTKRMFGRLVAGAVATARCVRRRCRRRDRGAQQDTTARATDRDRGARHGRASCPRVGRIGPSGPDARAGSARRACGPRFGHEHGHRDDGDQRWRSATPRSPASSRTRSPTSRPEFFFPAGTAPAVAAHPWVLDDYADPDGNITLRVQALVIGSVRGPCSSTRASATSRISCSPSGRTRSGRSWSGSPTPGSPPTAIDTVVHTHRARRPHRLGHAPRRRRLGSDVHRRPPPLHRR